MNTQYFPEASAILRHAIDKLLKGQKVAVLGHRRPDGDCIGSQVALSRVLLQNGVDAIAVNP
ncbi:MAG: bifunctional oligoribonuclease/PAP phosphatase NrnA, partial [Opitutae bacterium]